MNYLDYYLIGASLVCGGAIGFIWGFIYGNRRRK